MTKGSEELEPASLVEGLVSDSEAEVRGAGAIAQGEGGVAAGRGGVAVIGDANIIVGDIKDSGHIVAGRDVFIHYGLSDTTLASLFGTLRGEVAIQAPPGMKTDALEKIDNLEQALRDESPDFSVVRHVQEWFKDLVPTLVGALTSVMLHPSVRGKIEKQRDMLREEIRVHKRNLLELQERVARYGPSETPMHLVIQINSEQRAIEQLESLLSGSE